MGSIYKEHLFYVCTDQKLNIAHYCFAAESDSSVAEMSVTESALSVTESELSVTESEVPLKRIRHHVSIRQVIQ